MLHRNKNYSDAATVFIHTFAVTGALLVAATHAPLRAQTGDSLGFERRFFFNENPAPASVPAQESASPRATVIESNAPANSEQKVDSEGVQPSPSSARNLITSPAEAAPSPAPFRKTQAGDLVTANKPVPRGVRPIGTGRATWYEHPGRTASGEKFDPDRLTAAHKILPFGTRLRVVNVQNGRTVVVRVNDRVPLTTKHITIDLSRGSARAIGIKGVGRVALYRLDGPQ
jgi:rare lipoprotein A